MVYIPILTELYEGGQAINWVFNKVTNTPTDQVNVLTEVISAYDAGNVYGDLSNFNDIWKGGTEGGGGFQLPIVNRHAPEAIVQFAKSALPAWLLPAAIVGGALLLRRKK